MKNVLTDLSRLESKASEIMGEVVSEVKNPSMVYLVADRVQ